MKRLYKRKSLLTKRLRSKKRRTMKRRKMRGGEEYSCAICLEDLTNPNVNVRLSCNHIFHKECMRNVCNSSSRCKCPLCRKELNVGEMNELGLTMQRIGMEWAPYLDTVEEFKQYINNKLREPTRRPLELLNNELDVFNGTQHLPMELLNNTIMEFELQQIGLLERYQFTRIVENIPRNRSTNKYFKYIPYNDEEYGSIVENVMEL